MGGYSVTVAGGICLWKTDEDKFSIEEYDKVWKLLQTSIETATNDILTLSDEMLTFKLHYSNSSNTFCHCKSTTIDFTLDMADNLAKALDIAFSLKFVPSESTSITLVAEEYPCDITIYWYKDGKCYESLPIGNMTAFDTQIIWELPGISTYQLIG